MHHRRVWKIRLAVLAFLVVPGIAILVQHGLAADAAGKVGCNATMAREEGRIAASDFAPTDLSEAPSAHEAALEGVSTAACRKEPQCSVDSDCDVLCGVGLGKCVHSSCPSRICKCR